MVNSEVSVPHLPLEVWLKILSFLSGPDLFRCECVCKDWRQEIQHLVASGQITRRGLKCVRLITEKSGVTEHRRSVWDSISVKSDKRVVIVGVGVYTPSGQTQVCVDARPIEDNLRPIDVSTQLDSCDEDDGRAMTLFGKPGSTKPFRFLLEPGQWWEIMLNIKPVNNGYDPMSRNTCWTARGSGGLDEVLRWNHNFLIFKYCKVGNEQAIQGPINWGVAYSKVSD